MGGDRRSVAIYVIHFNFFFMSLFPKDSNVGMGSFSTEEKKPEIKEKVVKTEAPVVKQPMEKTPKAEPVKTEILPVEEEKKEPVDTKKESTSAKKTADSDEKSSEPAVFDFPTSVKIAGLTADENYTFSSENGGADNEVVLEESKNELFENLSDSEKSELDSIDSLYFQEFDSGKSFDGGISLNALLDLAIDQDASDIHISSSARVGFRVNGSIYFIEGIEPLSPHHMRGLIFSLVPNPLLRKKIFEERELDCAYEHVSGVNFRVNVFFKRGKLAAVLRLIGSHAFTIEQLGLPAGVKPLLQAKQGLLLVTGPTGSGKSTTMQTMLEYINETRVEHILTIEDPIEYLFSNKKSIFSQREIGSDSHSFSQALRASLREDPDVVMIGELRDAETVQSAMKLAETGHLVISTLHTASAAQTMARLASFFSSGEQDQVFSRLSDTILGVLSQRLVKRKDGEGRVGIYELLVANSAIRNIIRGGDVTQVENAMISGRDDGMIRMIDSAEALEEEGVIDQESYIHFFRQD